MEEDVREPLDITVAPLGFGVRYFRYLGQKRKPNENGATGW
jgi:hypothetical protein